MFDNALQRFQFYDKYSRFDYEKGRRETWEETVTRASEFLRELSGNELEGSLYRAIHDGILNGDVMPSMRLMAMAGPAARREHNVLYNCAYLPIDSLSSWVEMLTVCMGGSGVGYSVERKYVDLLPVVERQKQSKPLTTYTIEDSAQGWANALNLGLVMWYSGWDVTFDYSAIRLQGAPLKTKGGRASGPAPLKRLLNYSREIILGRQGERLTSLDAHDIATMVGDCVVQGGVRRSALLCLFDADDTAMITCKDPGNIEGNYHRYNANNSAVWDRSLSRDTVSEHIMAMHNGRNGEPGIFSRIAAMKTKPQRRSHDTFGTNPCGEIVLRPRQFCNLSMAIARSDDTEESLAAKVRLATVIGTIQASATNFPNLPDTWRKNCEEERLLGVDINGQLDCPLFSNGEETERMMRRMRDIVIDTNRMVAGALGIAPAAAATCVKPSGNSSTLLNCAPGLHPRHSHYYIRRVRVPYASSMYHVLYMHGVTLKPENGQEDWDNPSMYVAEFYVQAPDGAIVKGDRSAIEQLDYWLSLKKNFTEHNPSCTITYDENELEDIIDWVYENQAFCNGLSFLPNSDIMYAQAPYESITFEQYEKMAEEFPVIDFDYINIVDGGLDLTTAAQTLACAAGQCEII